MPTKLAIVGLGYVGMPLAQEAVASGLDVTGFDIARDTVAWLNEGHSHIDDLSDADIVSMNENGFVATSDPAALSVADVIVICVPTPLREDTTPDLGAVTSAALTIGNSLCPGTLVVLESTTYPGTTNDIVRPILESESGLTAGVDFHLAYSPERIDPGNPVYGIRNTPKIVGGFTEECTARAVEFYGQVVDTMVPTVGTREAEIAKLLENTYRHVNIALMNEMAVFSHELGIDLWSAIDAAKTKPFGFQAFYPGPGVGGHCIPIDPSYLSYAVKSLGYQFKFVELAQEISGRMPGYVATRAQGMLNEARKPVNGSSILLLGVTYKANISDERETPARLVARRLLDLGAEVVFYDSYVDGFSVDGLDLKQADNLESAVASADLVVLVQAHDDIMDAGVLHRAKLLLDTRGVADGPNVERL